MRFYALNRYFIKKREVEYTKVYGCWADFLTISLVKLVYDICNLDKVMTTLKMKWLSYTVVHALSIVYNKLKY